MPRLTDMSVTELLEAFSSSDPTPGGGSASGLASAVGCALLIMVASLPRSRSGSDDERRALADRVQGLRPVREALAALIERDSEAYDRVVEAYRMPKGSEAEKSARSGAIQAALKGASLVPLEVMRQSVEAIHHGADVARCGHRAAASDVAVALELLHTGLHGAALNVRINLEGLTDRAFANEIEEEVGRLESEGRQAVASALSRLKE